MAAASQQERPERTLFITCLGHRDRSDPAALSQRGSGSPVPDVDVTVLQSIAPFPRSKRGPFSRLPGESAPLRFESRSFIDVQMTRQSDRMRVSWSPCARSVM